MTLPRVVKIFKGKKGVRGQDGQDGLNGLGSERIRAGLIKNPLSAILESKNPAKLIQGPLSSFRNSEATYEDFYGKVITKGLSVSNNIFAYSNDFSKWATTNQTILSQSETDPFGGNTATRLSTTASVNGIQYPVIVDNTKFYTFSLWVKAAIGQVENFGVFGNFGYNQKTKETITSEFKRISFYFDPASNITELGFQFFCDVGTEVIVYGAMTEEGSVLSDYIGTNGETITVKNTNSQLLDFSDGYIFEGEVKNILISSESLISPWSLFSATATDYDQNDPFGNSYKQILLNCNGIGEGLFSLSQAVSIIDLEIYTLSFYAKKISGAITSLIVSLGGGESVSYETPEPAEFKRYEIQLTAGTINNILKLEMNSPGADAKVIFTGLMLELGNKKSSYVRTNRGTTTKTPNYIFTNSVNNIMPPQLNHSLVMNIYDYEIEQGEEFTIFDNGEVGVNNYAYILTSDSVNIRNAVEVLTIPYTVKVNKIAVTNDSGLISVYGNGELLGTVSITSQIVNFSGSAFYFANSQGEKNYNGKASNIEWFTKPLNADEIKYIHGSDL